MQFEGVKIRWFVENCFEIKLPNGKTIVIDPMLVREAGEDAPHMQKAFVSGYSVEDLEGADYVIINHTHGDHIGSLHDVCKKFNPVIICHAAAAMQIAIGCDVAPRKMFPYVANQRYDFGDFSFETFTGEHGSTIGDTTVSETIARFGGGPLDDQMLLNLYGSLFNTNFVITTADHVKIALNGGLFTEVMRNEWRKLRPNILLFHLINPDGTQKPYEEMAEIADYIGTQVMLPMRHQGICPEFGPLWGKKYDIADYVEAVNSILKERGSSARMISQKKGQWYRVYTGFDEI